jgi:hypothetical protein
VLVVGCRPLVVGQDLDALVFANDQKLETGNRLYPSSLAVIVILALSTLETGQPLLAFSAAF